MVSTQCSVHAYSDHAESVMVECHARCVLVALLYISSSTWQEDMWFTGAGITFGIFCVINLAIWALAGFIGSSATSLAMKNFR